MTRYNMKTITTPTGTARYCYLTNPSKGEYDSEYGTYRTELILDKADWDKLKAQVQPEYEAAYLAENTKQGKELKKANLPFVIDGEDHIVKLKMKAGGKRRDGTEYKLQVALFDSQGNPMKGDDIVGGGSRIKIGMKMRFWFVPAHGFGMTLEPQGVQVLELAAVGTSEKATSYGFTAEEGGYTNGGETFENTLDQPETNAEETKQEAPLSADF